MKRHTWFRAYTEALDNPKIQKLHPTLFKAWFNILCLAGIHGGVLPSTDDIAFRLRISVQDAEQHVDELILAGLIDIQPDGRRTPHNWVTRQFVTSDVTCDETNVTRSVTSSADRTRKYRERLKKKSCDASCDADVTGKDPYPETDTESNYPSSLDAESESEAEKLIDGLGTGRGGSVSIDGKRSVCAKLAIGNAEPLIALYDAWPRSRTARDPDALFIATAPKLYREASPEIRAACVPLGALPAEPLPPVQPSSSLIAHLNRGKRHARTT